MKYEQVKYIKDDKEKMIQVRLYSIVQLEEMEKEGEFFCPFKNCKAKVCLVHNSKNGGRTAFFKAVDDEFHIENCDYKIDNYKEVVKRVNASGYFTEEQITASVRSLYKDYTMPIEEKEEQKNKRKKKTGKGKGTTEDNENATTRKTTSAGKIVYGDETIDGIKGIMRRRYQVTSNDIGQMTKVCGVISNIEISKYGEMFVSFKDQRLNNIKIFIGPVYQTNNPTEYSRLGIVEEYYEVLAKKQEVRLAAGGLVNFHNKELVIELQAKGSFIIEGKTIMGLIRERTEQSMKNE